MKLNRELIFFNSSESFVIQVTEDIFRHEKNEKNFISTLKQLDTGDVKSIDKFLKKSEGKTIDEMINKDKIIIDRREVCKQVLQFGTDVINDMTKFSIPEDKVFIIGTSDDEASTIKLRCTIRVV